MTSDTVHKKKHAVQKQVSSLERTFTGTLPSYASLKRTTRSWSTSNDYTGEIPELTSQDCSQALTLFMHDYDNKTGQNPLLALATESSSHPSGLVTLFAQPYVYAGGGLGNIPECPIELQTCLAGGNKRDSLTFAAVCIVPQCTALDLTAQDFVGVLERAAGIESERDALQTSYVQLHSAIADLNKFLKTGWTCGEYKVPWKPFPFGLSYLVLLLGVAVMSFLGTFSRKKRHQSPRPSFEDRQVIVEEKKETASPPEAHFRSTLPQSVNHGYRNNETNHCENDNDDKSFRIHQAWNIRTHMASLFRYRPDTAALDGMRVVSILWVILGHVMAIQSSSGAGYNNPKDFLPPQGVTTTLGGQLLFASRFAVDTFLVLSGYLVVHVLLAKLPTRTISGRFWFLWNYIYTLPGLLLLRIMRILPVYAMSLGFWTQVAPHMGGGPFWYQWEPLLESCRMFGWTNLLFVNNFFPWNLANTETCFYHSWYLAIDVQLFLLAPLLVGWYRQSQMAGTVATTLLLSASVAITVYLSFTRGWSLNTFDGAAVARFDVEGYAKPHIRAQAYLAGMLLAMIRHSSLRQGGHRHPRTTWKHRLAMSGSLLCLATITFCTVTGAYSRRACRYTELPFKDNCGSTWAPFTTFLYAATSRAFWALGITVIISLCLSNRGGIVEEFLSWKGWTPLSHLTFGAYLVHPIVIFVWQLGDTQKESFRLTVFGMNYVSVCVVSFAASLLLSLLVELPCAALTKHFLGQQLLKRARKADRARAARAEDDLIQLLPSHCCDDPTKYGSVRLATSKAAPL